MTARTCHHLCWRCRPEGSPAAQVVTGTGRPEQAPKLTAAWGAIVERLTDDYQRRRPLILEAATQTRTAESTGANLIRAAVLAGIVDQVIVRDHRGHLQAWIRLPQPTTPQEPTP